MSNARGKHPPRTLRSRCKTVRVHARGLSLLVGLILRASAYAIGGEPSHRVFYALGPTGGEDRLYRIDLDENAESTLTPIGAPGALGFPTVVAIAWDYEGERLYGFDRLFKNVIEIDPVTGIGAGLSTTDLTQVKDITFNPNDYLLYVTNGGAVYSIEPGTGQTTQVIGGSTGEGLAHARDTVGGLDGLFTNLPGVPGLWFYPDPDFMQQFSLGGNIVNVNAMTWDPVSDTLYHVNSAGNALYTVNQVTGNVTLLADWANLGILVIGLTVVPGPIDESCTLMDTDRDGDIDLADYREWQNCFTGPAD